MSFNEIQTTSDIYSKLIENFEAHFISEKQRNAFVDYMRGTCDPRFTNDIMFFLEDFNSFLSQAIQAIKSLLAENARLIQNQNLSKIDNEFQEQKKNYERELRYVYSQPVEEKSYEKVIQKQPDQELEEEQNNRFEQNEEEEPANLVLKQPLRQQLKKLAKRQHSSPNTDREKEKPLKLSSLTEESKVKKDIEKMKVTNDILKNIEKTQMNKHYFVKKYLTKPYTKRASKDISKGYKEFLENIIGYKYDIFTLNNIKNDINESSTSRKSSHNLSSSSSVKMFKESLRDYSDKLQTAKQSKPFVQFTSPYGKLFQKNYPKL